MAAKLSGCEGVADLGYLPFHTYFTSNAEIKEEGFNPRL